MNQREIEALVRGLRRQGVEEFTFKSEGIELQVRFPSIAGPAAPQAAAAAAPASVAAPAAPPPAPVVPKAEHRAIRAPIVGTFYRSPAPDAPPYVKIGDHVRKGQVVCIIEAMKLMNQIESDQDGVVAEVLVESGNPVQFGTELLRLAAS